MASFHAVILATAESWALISFDLTWYTKLAAGHFSCIW